MMAALARLKGVMAVRDRLADLREMVREPLLTVNLMHERTAGNDPFYARITREFYRNARRRHEKFPLLRRFCHGVATCILPNSFDDYFMQIEAAARRNFKKASRGGFRFSAIDYNQHLDDIARIRRSAQFRQGKMPESMLDGSVTPVSNPPSRSTYHDYPYFGIVRDGKLFAYAGCFIAGEFCLIEHILGDAAVQSEGIVPMLIISIAEQLIEHYPAIEYYSYGTYFGAREDMRRFKRKFGFLPHRVRWQLNTVQPAAASAPELVTGVTNSPRSATACDH